MNTPLKLRNIGPKSAAWLRQVGLRTESDLRATGALEAFIRVKRAGFKPSLNLLYALEGALCDCHWQDIPAERRNELLIAADAAIAQMPPPRGRPAAAPVTTTMHAREEMVAPAFSLFDEPDGGSGSRSDSDPD
ncbi:MAG: transcriptional regulator [Lysobacteraceae bacterium]|nr:MAG: transcriptional regulator [Xanthomonadaceae bacterium]